MQALLSLLLNQSNLMKKFFLPLLVMLMSISAAFSQDDNVTSFRGIFWGAKRDSIYRDSKKLEFKKDGNTFLKNAYTLPGEELFIGNVRLNKVNYIFSDEGRFFKVQLEGPKEDYDQMKFILNYKFGDFKNESRFEGVHYLQWLVKDVTFTLAEYDALKFEVVIESNWQASEAYKKNTSVSDF
jgi:hypothetical protein